MGDDEDEEDAPFYIPNEANIENVKFYWRKMKCLKNPEDVYLHGNFDGASATSLFLAFQRCDPTKRICKSDDEIREWLGFKYFNVIYNQ